MITNDDKQEMIKLRGQGLSYSELARRFEIDHTTVIYHLKNPTRKVRERRKKKETRTIYCKRCQREFFPKGKQVYCGNRGRKEGCSYEMRMEQSSVVYLRRKVKKKKVLMYRDYLKTHRRREKERQDRLRVENLAK